MLKRNFRKLSANIQCVDLPFFIAIIHVPVWTMRLVPLVPAAFTGFPTAVPVGFHKGYAVAVLSSAEDANVFSFANFFNA